MRISLSIFSAEPQTSTNVVNQRDEENHIFTLLGTPPPLPDTAPPGKAMSLQSDGHSVEEDDIDDIIEPPEQHKYAINHLFFNAESKIFKP